MRRQAPIVVTEVEATPDGVFAAVRDSMERADWRSYISKGAEVALKPNLGWDKLIPGAISAPWMVDGVIRTIKNHVGEIHVVEADQVVLRADRALRTSGLDEVCRRHGVTWHNMSNEPLIRMEDSNRLVLNDIRIPEILTRTEVITLPVMKTHNKTKITGAIKNQWGCLEALRHHFHLVLSDALADVNSIVNPRFAVMDATVGLEGNGPKSGIPKEMDLVLASANLTGLDATAARLMGIDAEQVEHLERCASVGLGSVTGLDVRGVDLERHTKVFKPAQHNAVSWLELALRQSLLQKLAFHTPLFHVLCWGARRYYDLWDLFVGRQVRANFFASSKYTKQWRNVS
jgi:uncharacterized protein (DUF362 family)